MNTISWLDAVRPSGRGYLFTLDNNSPKQFVFNDNSDAHTKIDNAIASGQEVFVSLAQFKDDSSGRKAESADSCKSVWLDIDCGESDDKKYKTQIEAIKAAQAFCSLCKIPKPSVVVNSGGGVHLYWCFDTNISVARWKPISEDLKALCKAHNLHIDPAVMGDASRVMRVPGSANLKLPNSPRAVDIKHPNGEAAYFDVQSFHDLIKTAAKCAVPSIPGIPLLRPRSEATRNILTSESAGEIDKLKAALAKLSPDTARGSGRFYAHDGKPEDDYWMAVLWAIASLQWACGKELAREWSKGSQRYSDDGFEHAWSQFNPNHPSHIGIGSLYKRTSEMGCLQADTKVGIPAIKGIPQSLPGELKLVTAFDPALFPQSIRAGVVDISERLNCSIDYVAIAVLAGAGAVLGNSVGVWPKEHDETWIVHPSLWGGIVGSPGSMKTPALNAALKPVHDLEEIAATKYKTDYLAYTKAMADYEKAMNSGSGSIPQVPAKPIKKRYTVNDVTYQALGLLLADNPQGILALSDELSGLLQSLDTQGQEAARGFFLSGWGGQGFYTFDRVGRGPVSLTRYSVAVFGGFQPDRIRAYVRSAQGGSTQNDGLLQRFQLLVWPDQPATFTLIDRPANKAALSSMHQAITNLDMLSKVGITGATRINSGLQLLHFAPDAQLVFNKWLHANEVLLRSGTLSSSESSHFAKYRSLIPALALLFHLLDGNQELIKLEYLEAAIGFSEYLQSHAKRIYASINGQDHAPIRALAEKLISGGVSDGFTQRALLHKGWANLSKEASVKMALDALVEYGWLTENESINPGRKTTIYTINANIGAHLL